MLNKTLFLILIFSFTHGLINAEIEKEDKIIQVGASYTGDNVYNTLGGIKKGYSYLGLAHLNLLLETKNAGWWQGGSFYVNAANTHGTIPSESLIGDIQVVSNIEAGEHTYLQELWYKHSFNSFEITVGLQDLNVEIANIENGSLFLNSSFGVLPTISMNLHAPIFPLTSPGITTKLGIGGKLSWLNAIYDGTPTDFEENPYNICWNFKSGDGALFISEIQYKTEIAGRIGTHKLGIFAHDHIIERSFVKELPDSLDTNTSGIYLLSDQQLWERNNRSIDAFFQLGLSNSEMSLNKHYVGLGLSATGFLSKSNTDKLGVAVAFANLRDNLGHETAIEITLYKEVCKHLYIQPNFQYIITPSGKQSGLSNALVAILRFGFEI